MDRERLFLGIYRELEERIIAEPSEYNVLKIAGLLRQLLLDKHRLVDMVNKPRPKKPRLDIKYEVMDKTPLQQMMEDLKPVFWTMQDGIYPKTALIAGKTKIVDRDGLLSYKVMSYAGFNVTVKDIIVYEANFGGAIHAEAPRGAVEKAIHEAANSVNVGGYPPQTRQLLAIARVVLDGLRPLKEQIAQLSGR